MHVCLFLVEYCLLMEGHIQHLGKVRLNSVIRSSSQSPNRKLLLSSVVQNLRSWGSSWAIEVPGMCFCDEEIERLHMG